MYVSFALFKEQTLAGGKVLRRKNWILSGPLLRVGPESMNSHSVKRVIKKMKTKM